MPAALAIPAIATVGAAAIGATASGIGAAKASNAAKEAARIQSASADKALAEQKRIFDLQRGDRAPYLAASTAALGNLGQLAGRNQYMALPAQQLGASSPQMASSAMNPSNQVGTLDQLGNASPGPQMPQNGAMAQAMGVFRAPDGETRSFPLSMEAQLIAKGAKRVQ